MFRFSQIITQQRLIMKKIIATAISSVLFVTAHDALAGQAGSNTTYSLTVTATCSITSPNAVSFGTSAASDPAQIDVNAGTVQITCPADKSYAFGVNGGQNYLTGTHFLKNGSSLIGYQLKNGNNLLGDVGLNAKDPSYTEGTTENAVVNATGTGSAQNYPITADIAAIPSTAIAGIHSDTVTYTVAF